jgi:hypothetical protein
VAVIAVSSSPSVIAVVPPSSVIVISSARVPLPGASPVSGPVARFQVRAASVVACVSATSGNDTHRQSHGIFFFGGGLVKESEVERNDRKG